MQVTDFVLLTSSIIVILYFLSKQELETEDMAVFKREKCTLLTILIIFDISFVLRFVTDIFTSHASRNFEYDMLPTINAIVTPQVCDLIPICCILYIHSRNFKAIKDSSDAVDNMAEPQLR